MSDHKKYKVGFLFTMNQVMSKYSGVLNLYEEMKRDENFDVEAIYISPHESQLEFLKKENATRYSSKRVSGDNPEFDFVVTIDPYFGPHGKGLGYRKWTSKIIYIGYGTTGISRGYKVYHSDVYNHAWIAIVDREESRDLLVKESGIDPNKVFIGHPLFDNNKNYTPTKSSKPVIMWTPHCSIVSDPKYDKFTGGRYSTFLTYANQMKDMMKRYDNVDFVIKPHPFLRTRLNQSIDKGLVDYFDLDKWVAEISSLPNVSILGDSVDYYQAFINSDALMNDSISFLLEYLITEKPMLILRDNASSKFSDYAEDLINRCYYETFNING